MHAAHRSISIGQCTVTSTFRKRYVVQLSFFLLRRHHDTVFVSQAGVDHRTRSLLLITRLMYKSLLGSLIRLRRWRHSAFIGWRSLERSWGRMLGSGLDLVRLLVLSSMYSLLFLTSSRCCSFSFHWCYMLTDDDIGTLVGG